MRTSSGQGIAVSSAGVALPAALAGALAHPARRPAVAAGQEQRASTCPAQAWRARHAAAADRLPAPARALMQRCTPRCKPWRARFGGRTQASGAPMVTCRQRFVSCSDVRGSSSRAVVPGRPTPCPVPPLRCCSPRPRSPRRSTLAADEQVVWRWRSVSRASGERWQQLGQALVGQPGGDNSARRPDGLGRRPVRQAKHAGDGVTAAEAERQMAMHCILSSARMEVMRTRTRWIGSRSIR